MTAVEIVDELPDLEPKNVAEALHHAALRADDSQHGLHVPSGHGNK